jgi:hypothetical protein
MSLSTAYDNKVLDSMFGDNHASYAVAAHDLGLSSSQPGKDGSSITEPSGGSYTRVVNIANTTANWPDASAGSKSNANAVLFPTATASWGTMAYWVLFETGTNTVVAFGSLITPTAIPAGSTPNFPSGSLVISAD